MDALRTFLERRQQAGLAMAGRRYSSADNSTVRSEKSSFYNASLYTAYEEDENFDIVHDNIAYLHSETDQMDTLHGHHAAASGNAIEDFNTSNITAPKSHAEQRVPHRTRPSKVRVIATSASGGLLIERRRAAADLNIGRIGADVLRDSAVKDTMSAAGYFTLFDERGHIGHAGARRRLSSSKVDVFLKIFRVTDGNIPQPCLLIFLFG